MAISLESMDGARAKVTQREESFDAAINTGTQYASFANAGAMVALLSFIGATGKEITNVALMALPFIAFVTGISASAYGIYQNARLKKANLSECIASLAAAVHLHDDITAFNDTANDADLYLNRIEKSSLVAFSAFAVGILISATLFPFLHWAAGDAEKSKDAAPVYVSASSVCSAGAENVTRAGAAKPSRRSPAPAPAPRCAPTASSLAHDK